MTITLATLMATCAPLVHPTTLRALIEVESGGNPYVVSINHPQALIDRGIDPPAVVQPHTKSATLDLVRSLRGRGLGVSLGLAQINVDQLAEEHLRIADLFDPCTNLVVAQRVLLDCDAKLLRRGVLSARPRLRRTLVCYNSGDCKAGFHNPYVSSVRRAAVRHFYRRSGSIRSPA
jgi:type IV secretion system protein VirB1